MTPSYSNASTACTERLLITLFGRPDATVDLTVQVVPRGADIQSLILF